MRKSISNQPSLVDVAARANVSAGTVSHVLNGNHKARIALATPRTSPAERPRSLATVPNVFARSLLGKKSKTLGIMTNNLDNPFFIGVARAAWKRAHEIGYEMLFDVQFTSQKLFRDRPRPRALPADGLLLWAETVQGHRVSAGPGSGWITDRLSGASCPTQTVTLLRSTSPQACVRSCIISCREAAGNL